MAFRLVIRVMILPVATTMIISGLSRSAVRLSFVNRNGSDVRLSYGIRSLNGDRRFFIGMTATGGNAI